MMSKYKLIVGLGNFGREYSQNRHNTGFIILDNFTNSIGDFEYNSKFDGDMLKSNGIIFLKPRTFMNLSGKSVVEVMNFFKISPNEILVIQDDLDLEFGKIKISTGSGDAGHNGIKDLISKLGTKDFTRLRFGIGRPEGFQPVEDFVLSNFSQDELDTLNNFKFSDYLN